MLRLCGPRRLPRAMRASLHAYAPKVGARTHSPPCAFARARSLSLARTVVHRRRSVTGTRMSVPGDFPPPHALQPRMHPDCSPCHRQRTSLRPTVSCARVWQRGWRTLAEFRAATSTSWSSMRRLRPPCPRSLARCDSPTYVLSQFLARCGCAESTCAVSSKWPSLALLRSPERLHAWVSGHDCPRLGLILHTSASLASRIAWRSRTHPSCWLVIPTS